MHTKLDVQIAQYVHGVCALQSSSFHIVISTIKFCGPMTPFYDIMLCHDS